MGAREQFEIWTDHQNLQYFRKPQKLNCRQAHWVMELLEYKFILHHKPGTSMGKADALSRMTNLETGVNDNKDIIVLKPKLFINNICETKSPEDPIINKIIKYANNMDKSVVEALNGKDKYWVNEHGGIVMWKKCIYIPKKGSYEEKS